jgi:hypothetical protein
MDEMSASTNTAPTLAAPVLFLKELLAQQEPIFAASLLLERAKESANLRSQLDVTDQLLPFELAAAVKRVGHTQGKPQLSEG